MCWRFWLRIFEARCLEDLSLSFSLLASPLSPFFACMVSLSPFFCVNGFLEFGLLCSWCRGRGVAQVFGCTFSWIHILHTHEIFPDPNRNLRIEGISCSKDCKFVIGAVNKIDLTWMNEEILLIRVKRTFKFTHRVQRCNCFFTCDKTSIASCTVVGV